MAKAPLHRSSGSVIAVRRADISREIVAHQRLLTALAAVQVSKARDVSDGPPCPSDRHEMDRQTSTKLGCPRTNDSAGRSTARSALLAEEQLAALPQFDRVHESTSSIASPQGASDVATSDVKKTRRRRSRRSKRANIPSPKVDDEALRHVTEVASVKNHSGASAVQDAGIKSGSTSQDVGIKSESQARNTDSNGVCHEDLQVALVSDEDHAIKTIRVENPPSRAEELLQLPVQSWESMLKDFKNEEVEQLCLVTELAAHSSTEDPDVAAKTQRELR
ncbi:hypothetical protein ATCC90586_010676 [Pythium insidiosum]|nr:hypothetical protein ATCC90586_010676 [Pythium insidiosum]